MAGTQCRMSDHDGGETQSTLLPACSFPAVGRPSKRNCRTDASLRSPATTSATMSGNNPIRSYSVMETIAAGPSSRTDRQLRSTFCPAPPPGASPMAGTTRMFGRLRTHRRQLGQSRHPPTALPIPYVGTNQSKWRSRYECASMSAIEVAGPRFEGAWRPGKRRCCQ